MIGGNLFLSERRAYEHGHSLVHMGKAKRFRVFRRVIREKDLSVSIGYAVVTFR